MAESRAAVFAAIGANAVIAVCKFTAAAYTGSSAMLSEAIHSVVDMGNGGLIYLGMKRSERPADDGHPFGHGKELYFWTLIVAISVFGIGGGMSIFEGVLHLQHPSPLEDPTISYIVLAAAAVFEGASFIVAFRQFRAEKGTLSTVRAIRSGKDPSLFTVVFEDSTALVGLVVAFAGVYAGHALGNPYLDAVASIVIGGLLCLVALWLAAESKGLLIGESADEETVRGIRAIVEDDPDVVAAGSILTMYLGPHDALLNLEVTFAPRLGAERIHAAIHRLEASIKGRYPDFVRIYVELEALTAATAPAPSRERDE